MAERPSVADALELIADALTPLGSERVEAAGSLGRIVANAPRATLDVPRFAASAMDGYALRSEDVAGATAERPVLLPLVGPFAAGSVPGHLPPRHSAGISTGAAMPDGADCVLLVEQARLAGDHLSVAGPIAAGRNVRAPGEDVVAGADAIPAGITITPDAIAALVAFGVDMVEVLRRPALALMTTGAELRGEGQPLAPGMIVDSNGPMIRAAAAQFGLPCRTLGHVIDEAAAVNDALAAAIEGEDDILLSTGGVSAGRFDLVRDALERRGARIMFHGVSMRPGKPMLFALLPDGRPFFGLPGNPVAAMVSFRFFVMAAVRRMTGLPAEQGEPVATAATGKPGTTLFLRSSALRVGGGGWQVDTGADQRSHVLRSVVAANAWLRVEGDGSALLYPKWPTLG